MERRQFLKKGLEAGLAAGSLALPFSFPASALAKSEDLGFDLTRGSRSVALYRPSTGESLSLEYLRDGVWVEGAYARLCWLLRDVRAQQHVAMDVRLIATLDWTQRYLKQYGYTQPLHILSGYRSAQTNAGTEGAAKNSQHLYGKAIDIRIPGLSADYLGKLFSWLSQGGVGVYSDSSFVHIDTGRIRHWRG